MILLILLAKNAVIDVNHLAKLKCKFINSSTIEYQYLDNLFINMNINDNYALMIQVISD